MRIEKKWQIEKAMNVNGFIRQYLHGLLSFRFLIKLGKRDSSL